MSAIEDIITDNEDSPCTSLSKIETKLDDDSITQKSAQISSEPKEDSTKDVSTEEESMDISALSGQGDSSITPEGNLLKNLDTNKALSPDNTTDDKDDLGTSDKTAKEDQVKGVEENVATNIKLDDIDDDDMALKWDEDDNSNQSLNDSRMDIQIESSNTVQSKAEEKTLNFDDDDMELKWDEDDNSNQSLNDSKMDMQIESSNTVQSKAEEKTLNNVEKINETLEYTQICSVVVENKNQEINTKNDSEPDDVINLDNKTSVSEIDSKVEEINQGSNKTDNFKLLETSMDTDNILETIKNTENIKEDNNKIQDNPIEIDINVENPNTMSPVDLDPVLNIPTEANTSHVKEMTEVEETKENNEIISDCTTVLDTSIKPEEPNLDLSTDIDRHSEIVDETLLGLTSSKPTENPKTGETSVAIYTIENSNTEISQDAESNKVHDLPERIDDTPIVREVSSENDPTVISNENLDSVINNDLPERIDDTPMVREVSSKNDPTVIGNENLESVNTGKVEAMDPKELKVEAKDKGDGELETLNTNKEQEDTKIHAIKEQEDSKIEHNLGENKDQNEPAEKVDTDFNKITGEDQDVPVKAFEEIKIDVLQKDNVSEIENVETNTQKNLVENPTELENTKEQTDEIPPNLNENKDETSDADISLDVSTDFYKKDHDLNRPDAMLEIPTQELIDIDDIDLTFDKSDANLTIDNEPKEEQKEVQTDKEIVGSENLDPKIGEIDVNKEQNAIKTVANISETIDDVQPSTSKAATSFMTPDSSDEIQEVSDSLGLLAESSGRMMDDDEPEDDDDDDDNDGDDYDQDMDESSNQVSPEPLEDSNAASEIAIDQKEIEGQELETQELDIAEESNECEQQKIETEIDLGIDKECSELKLDETSDNDKEQDANIPTDAKDVTIERETEKKEKIKEKSESPKQSPSKVKKLEITAIKSSNVLNIVDLEESSSEDDVQEVKKDSIPPPEVTSQPDDVLTVNIPTGIDIMSCSGENTSEIVTKDSETVINVPKPPAPKPARLNTSEVTIKTATNTESTLIITEAKNTTETLESLKPKMGLEIFNLDSDDEEPAEKQASPPKPAEPKTLQKSAKCINLSCTSGSKVLYRIADAADILYYDAMTRRRNLICQICADVVEKRTKNLVAGIKNMTPLFDLDMDKGEQTQDLVEISDSESEEEDLIPEPYESIGIKGAKLLEENLADMLNEAWLKYNLDARLDDTKTALNGEIEKLEQASKEINQMLDTCQIATDKLRNDLYATFEPRKAEEQPWSILDTNDLDYNGPEEKDSSPPPPVTENMAASRASKRRSTTSVESPAKRPAIPLGYTPLDESNSQNVKPEPEVDSKLDDDKDVSVVQLSAEAAPCDLPPPGALVRPPLRVNQQVYAMKNAFGPWLKGRIVEINSKENNPNLQFTSCRVKFDHKNKVNGKVLPARCIAYYEPAEARMSIGTRLIGLFKDANQKSFYSGVVAEVPNPVNNYRYLVFFDDGYAQYVHHSDTRLVCECSNLVWEEVHPFSREFVREYLLSYPERPMVRLHEGQHLKTEWNGKWWSSKVVKVDASLAQVLFLGDGRQEWIYRGSTRLAPLYLELQAAGRHRPRAIGLPRSKAQNRTNMPYVEYIRSDDQESKKQDTVQQQQNEEIRRQRAVAKKSTATPALPPQSLPGAQDTISSRVVYYTPKNAVKPLKMVPHTCSSRCKRSDVLSLQDLRTYNPLAKPLLSGWERQIVRFKGHKEVLYRAPCGRRLRNMKELHCYLRLTQSELPVDLFDFQPPTHCLAEFVLNKCIVGKKDLSHGKENVPVPCVNYYDDTLPEFCSYNTERTPTAGVPLNLDPDFLCGCDCTDDCEDKTKCACWKMTLEGARTIGLGSDVGYVYKRLPEPLPSGIYECNSRCRCKHTCLNRVAQHPLQLKLQVFKTLNRGWGIRALNDVPKGSFLCVYAGNLLTDATANLDGLNEGDEYLAELDYIEVVEQMKEGYEEDIPLADKKLDKKDTVESEEEEELTSSEEEGDTSKSDKEDGDFTPGYIGLGLQEFSKRLRKRDRNKKDKKENAEKKDKTEDDCITISDDEERREPSRFAAQPGMGANDFISKYRSVRTLFGKDEACYIMDAKVQGNIGRYLNHSCTPNVFVQNVFVDTHDPRFPWVAFFALSHIKAGTELTWNYNYDVGSVPGKVLYCYCGAPNCRGRLL